MIQSKREYFVAQRLVDAERALWDDENVTLREISLLLLRMAYMTDAERKRIFRLAEKLER